MDLKSSITKIKGIGEKKASLLLKLGISTIEDMLYFFPRQYEDRSIIKKISDLEEGETQTFIGSVTRVERDMIFSKKIITKVHLKDETGFIVAVWYGQTYIKNIMKPGSTFLFTGKIEKRFSGIEVQVSEYEEKRKDVFVHTGRIIPVYSSTKSLTQKIIRNMIYSVLNSLEEPMREFIPEEIRKKYDICEINYAIHNIHFPENKEAFLKARRRFVFEELLLTQLSLSYLKENINKKENKIICSLPKELKEFINSFSFELTNAQKKVANELYLDLKGKNVMNRLIQGDVGSGKTIIAALALFILVKNQYQGVLMAPTEVLARQHFSTLEKLFSPFGLKAELLVGSLSLKQKNKIYEKLIEGEIDVLIGTHAIIQDKVKFKNLGLVITDEQHRFGVRQRAILSSKGEDPHVLVMTATPIPRTLALILYGDLDVSIINELPPGRQKINTYGVNENYRQRINGFIMEQISQGRQVYIICPMVEENEESDLKSVVQYTERIKEYFPSICIQYLHGKMKPQEKNEIMDCFEKGEIKILVSTTVVEVGVNVPNATIMLIENAERFGLAQLHQLRGRVGRGKHKSYCILFTESDSKTTKEKIKIMKESNDGFLISEKDLEIRGPGEFFGTRQHGLPEFKIANLFKDLDILKEVQQECVEIMRNKKVFEKKEYKELKEKIVERFSTEFNDLSFN